MAKKTAKLGSLEPASSSTPEPESQRPGTSGTELLLTTNRRAASAQYLAAQRAEQAYKAKKRSAGARQHRSDAKAHFKQSAFHAKEGFKSTWGIFAALPWIFREWKENRTVKSETKRRERDMKKKEKLEERIAKQAEADAGKEKGKNP